jgi:hypothetical protein
MRSNIKVAGVTGNDSAHVPLFSAVKEANPSGGDECSMSPRITKCFHSYEEQVSHYWNRM